MAPSKFVYLDDGTEWERDAMEFRLTYDGPLLATQGEPHNQQADPKKRAENKHALRQRFHAQLRRFWEITPYLEVGQAKPKASEEISLESLAGANFFSQNAEALATTHALYGHNFVPLVTEELCLSCSIDILLLRPDRPGGVVWAGDIDNRIKTLLDALRIPVPGERYVDRTLNESEKPFFCLLEDDKLITRLAVETDQLLEFNGGNKNMNEVRLVITVRLRPQHATMRNMDFV